MAAGAGVGGVIEAVAVAELGDPTQMESSHLALQTRVTSLWTEMMFVREVLVAIEATGSTDRLRVVPKRDAPTQTLGRCR